MSTFFRGPSITARQQGDLFVVAPAGGTVFESPPGTHELYLPSATTLHVRAEPLPGDGWAALVFQGEYSRVDRPAEVRLSPVRASDARMLAALLTTRLGLPRRPRSIRPEDLVAEDKRRPAADEYVRMIGTQSPTRVHFEAADFSGCKLDGPVAGGLARRPGARYAVTGFYRPPASASVVGYRGPSLRVTEIRAEPAGALREEARRPAPVPVAPSGVVESAGESERDGLRDLSFFTAEDADTRVVAALHGFGGQRTGGHAARVGRLVLATLLKEPSYGALLGPAVEPVPEWWLDEPAWVAWVADHGPLPGQPAPLLTELSSRIGRALGELDLRGASLGVDGLLCHLKRDRRKEIRATLLGRGLVRAYLVRGTENELVVPEASMAAEAKAMGLRVDPSWLEIRTSSFGFGERPSACREVSLFAGDRLLLVTGAAILHALDEPAAVARLVSAFPDVAGGSSQADEMRRQGWCAILLGTDWDEGAR